MHSLFICLQTPRDSADKSAAWSHRLMSNGRREMVNNEWREKRKSRSWQSSKAWWELRKIVSPTWESSLRNQPLWWNKLIFECCNNNDIKPQKYLLEIRMKANFRSMSFFRNFSNVQVNLVLYDWFITNENWLVSERPYLAKTCFLFHYFCLCKQVWIKLNKTKQNTGFVSCNSRRKISLLVGLFLFASSFEFNSILVVLLLSATLQTVTRFSSSYRSIGWLKCTLE